MAYFGSFDADLNITLSELNAERATIYYGAVIFLGTLTLPGVIGNLHVLYIYIFRKPDNNTRVYVCFLAVVDLGSCAVCFPFNIVNCLLPLMFDSDVACKILMFLNSYVAVGSALLLLLIAIERFRKICKPFGAKISILQAKLSCVSVVMLTTVFSLPTLFLYGSTEVQTRHPNITGYGCNVYTRLQDTLFPTIFNGYLMFVSCGLCSVLTVLYTLIGIRIKRLQDRMGAMRETERERFNVLKKTTNMLCLITVFFVLSYVPYPILRLYQIYNMDWYNGLNLTGLVTFHLAICSLFLNNVCNPFIYMVCDSTFRKELKTLYRM